MVYFVFRLFSAFNIKRIEIYWVNAIQFDIERDGGLCVFLLQLEYFFHKKTWARIYYSVSHAIEYN